MSTSRASTSLLLRAATRWPLAAPIRAWPAALARRPLCAPAAAAAPAPEPEPPAPPTAPEHADPLDQDLNEAISFVRAFATNRVNGARTEGQRMAYGKPRPSGRFKYGSDEPLTAAEHVESVDVAISLNVDTKRSDERVRGSAVLPHSTGKQVRLAVFARGANAEEARAAGADLVGEDDLVREVSEGRIDFDRVLATPDMLPALAKVARILGPKGLMPTPKRGTVVTDITPAVERVKAGEVEFKANPLGQVHACVGKVDFPTEVLRENTAAFVRAVLEARPTRFRGKPPKSITLSTLTGRGVPLDPRLWARKKRF